MTEVFEWLSGSPARTLALGRALGRTLCAGDVVALTGVLGAGKTQLVKGLAAGIGVSADEPVVSPTFVLMRQYAGRLVLHHIDAYRLMGGEDLLALGFDELLREPGAVVAVEWADRVSAAIPIEACWIGLEHAGPRQRRVRVRWTAGGRLAELASRWEGG